MRLKFPGISLIIPFSNFTRQKLLKIDIFIKPETSLGIDTLKTIDHSPPCSGFK